MNLAFWKRSGRKPARSGRAGRATADAEATPEGEEQLEEAARRIRSRLRRRLIGAAALLLGAVVLVPMALDPAPAPLPDNIPIDLPNERSAFPASASPDAVNALRSPAEARGAEAGGGAEAPPAAPGSAADAAPAGTASASLPASAQPQPAAAPSSTAAPSSQPSSSATAPASAADAATAGRPSGRADRHRPKIYVQAAALGSETAAKELAARISKSGLAPFIESTQTADGTRYRVRLGPYSSREDAEHSRSRLRALGVHSNLVLPTS